MKKRLLPFTVFMLLVSAFFTACSPSQNGEIPELLEPAVVDIDTATAKLQELYNISCYEGTVEPEISEYKFATSGMIAEINVCTGSSVKAGDILARLDVNTAQSHGRFPGKKHSERGADKRADEQQQHNAILKLRKPSCSS
jgi:multidrug efflux pump subunit AcrA (membrane-fusion protein)